MEVYNPSDDVWEDGVPLTSGRSGLASAVIYQPSCPQNYSQECTVAQNPTKRDYDDNRRLPPNNGNSSSMHCNYSSNVHSSSNLRGSGGSGNRDSNEVDETNCDESNNECPKHVVNNSCVFMRMRERCKFRNNHQRLSTEKSFSHSQNLQLQQQHQHKQKTNDINCNLEKIVRSHTKCKNTSCSIQRLRRKFQHFLYNHIKQSDYQCSGSDSKT